MTASWLIFLVLLPFREGSGSPEGLLVAHLAFLFAAAATVATLRGVARPSVDLLLPSIALLAVSGLSGALGSYRYASLLAVLDLAVVLGILVLIEAGVRRSARSAPLLLVAVAVSGIMQAALSLSPWPHTSATTLLNPNHAAAYLVLAFWSLIALGDDWPVGGRSARIVFSALLLAAALLQASRGALLGLVTGGAVYLAARLRTMERRARIGALAAALAILLTAAVPLIKRLSTKDDPFLWDRMSLWSVSLRVAAENPILGVGPGVFPYRTSPFDPPRRDRPVRHGKHVEATHSDYLRVVAETGIIGALAALSLLALVGVRAARALRHGSGREAALASALGGILAQCAVENLSTRPAVSYTGALLTGVLLAARPSRAEGSGRARGKRSPVTTEGASGTRGREEPLERVPSTHVAALHAESGEPAGAPRHAGRATTRADGTVGLRRSAGWVLLAGVILWFALVFVLAPYLGNRAFTLFRTGGPRTAERYARAVFWCPIHPDYRAALAEAVLRGNPARPGDLREGFLAIDEAIALKPIDPRYALLRARLARAAFAAGRGDADWIAVADEDYARAERLDPLRPQAHLERGWMHLSLATPSKAFVEAGHALGSEPDCFEARRLEVAALIALGRAREARGVAEKARVRHAELASFRPENDYETAVLRWDREGWEEVDSRLVVPGG